MRGIALVILSLAMVSGARASSILVLGDKPAGRSSVVTLGDAQGKAPSVVALGEPAAQTTASPSVVVLGEPAVGDDRVAAIPARAGGVLVIRAGESGGASAAPAAAPAAAAATAADSAGAAGKASNGTLRDAMTQAGQAPAAAQ